MFYLSLDKVPAPNYYIIYSLFFRRADGRHKPLGTISIRFADAIFAGVPQSLTIESAKARWCLSQADAVTTLIFWWPEACVKASPRRWFRYSRVLSPRIFEVLRELCEARLPEVWCSELAFPCILRLDALKHTGPSLRLLYTPTPLSVKITSASFRKDRS